MPPSRIDELRRRVQNDPASIAFAQLAEEYRRAGMTDDAVRICREGLTRHPGYLSARVTLGRALLDLGEQSEARGEFEFVVAEAPENLAAVRGLAEICHREGQLAEALSYYERALALSRHDPEIEEIVQQLSRQVGASQTQGSSGLSFEEAHQELLSAAERVPLAPSASPSRPAAETEGSTAPFDFDRLVAALGSPTAPPQFEAAVAGQASAAPIELPDVPDLGPNPFAALEAELRAHEAAPLPAAAPWAPVPVEAGVEAPVETVSADEPATPVPAADMTLDASAADPFAGLVSMAPAEAEPAFDLDTAAAALDLPASDRGDGLADTLLADTVGRFDTQATAELPSAIDELLAAPEPVLDAPVLAAPVADAVPAAVATPEPGQQTTVVEPAPIVVAAAARADDNVLDDLESWLSTLHDRSTE